MKDSGVVQSLDHLEKLDGEVDRHRLDGGLRHLTRLDDVDDVQKGSELLVV